MTNWIKCSDRLPDYDEYVLTYRKGSQCLRINWYSTHSNNWMTNENTDYGAVTQWCELPEPPKENE